MGHRLALFGVLSDAVFYFYVVSYLLLAPYMELVRRSVCTVASLHQHVLFLFHLLSSDASDKLPRPAVLIP